MLILWQKAVSNQDSLALLDLRIQSLVWLGGHCGGGLEIDSDDARFRRFGGRRHRRRRREIESFMSESRIVLIQLFGKSEGFFTSEKLLTLAPTRFRFGPPRDHERIFHNAIRVAVLIARGNGQ